MTALCSGGTSSPKTGLAEVVAISSGAIALALQRYGAAKLQFLIPLLGLPPLELPTFCASDPPAMPTFTSDEVFSLLRVGLDSDYFSGLAKARDMVLRMLWYDLCECDAGSPSAIGAPGLPTDTPDPILPAPPAVVACKTGQVDYGPGGPIVSTGTFIGGLGRNIGQVTTAVRITGTLLASSGSPSTVTAHYDGGPGTPPTAVGATQVFTVGSTFVTTLQWVEPLSALNIKLFSTAASSNVNWTAKVEFFCNGDAPGGTQTPCCPPDPATQNSLDLILQMITLIQRQLAPFGYVAGAVHTGLSGAGTLAIGGLLGVKVDVTTLPASYGSEGTSPPIHFDLGFLTFGTADGFPTSVRLERNPQLILPARCSAYTDLDYDLAPGVVVTITDLAREP